MLLINAVAVGAALGAAIGAPAAAQQFPSRPLRIIVAFAPGGPSDIVARMVAQKLGESLGQTVVVDNRPGGGGNVGIGLAARAPADGHTLLVASSVIAVNIVFSNPGMSLNEG